MELRNLHDVHKWIMKVINSCTTFDQLDTAYELIRNFSRLYNNFDYHCFSIEQSELHQEKFDFLMNKRISLLSSK